MSRKALKRSQVFLKNPYWILPYIRKYFSKNLPLIEIGTGKGDLTRIILQVFEKGSLLGIEKDIKLCHYLWKKKLRVLNEDFLEFNTEQLANKQIIGSLPYQGSKKIIDKIGQSNFRCGLFIIQKEVFEHLKERSEEGTSRGLRFVKLKKVSPLAWKKPPKVWGILFYLFKEF